MDLFIKNSLNFQKYCLICCYEMFYVLRKEKEVRKIHGESDKGATCRVHGRLVVTNDAAQTPRKSARLAVVGTKRCVRRA